jgi:hypothetical protein
VREYYNRRTGQGGDPPRWTIDEAARLTDEAYRFFDDKGYFQRSFGYWCVDLEDPVPGIVGSGLEMTFYRLTSIRVKGRFSAFIKEADELQLFTAIEFLYDHIAEWDKSQGGRHHSGCGVHFDPEGDFWYVHAGQEAWRARVNEILHLYGDGYELSDRGEVVRLAPDGMTELVDTSAPAASGDTNVAKVANAVRTFRRGLSRREEQKQAVRDLADVLEFYRQEIKTVLLKEDERDLFNIANNFAIRHHNANQRDKYDGAWLNYLFYLFLATVHLALALIHGTPMPTGKVPPPPDDSGPLPSDDGTLF